MIWDWPRWRLAIPGRPRASGCRPAHSLPPRRIRLAAPARNPAVSMAGPNSSRPVFFSKRKMPMTKINKQFGSSNLRTSNL